VNKIFKTVKIELSHKVSLPGNIALWKLSIKYVEMFFKFVQFFQGGLSPFILEQYEL
jgi:hypothetical protein